MMSRKCPVCNSDLVFETPISLNQQVTCQICGLELEVVWLYPLELAKVISKKPDPTKSKKQPKKTSR